MFEKYIGGLQGILQKIEAEQCANIRTAAGFVAKALSAGAVIHVFGTGHSHMIAEEAFFRAGGIAAVNPILNKRLLFLKGALESTRAEREEGFALELIRNEDVRAGGAAIVISNSGRNAVPIEMALEMKARGASVIAITNIRRSRGSRLYKAADVAIDNCVPEGDALLEIPGLRYKMGACSTVAGAAIVNSIMIEAAAELTSRGEAVPVLPSANTGEANEEILAAILSRYGSRIRYFDAQTHT